MESLAAPLPASSSSEALPVKLCKVNGQVARERVCTVVIPLHLCLSDRVVRAGESGRLAVQDRVADGAGLRRVVAHVCQVKVKLDRPRHQRSSCLDGGVHSCRTAVVAAPLCGVQGIALRIESRICGKAQSVARETARRVLQLCLFRPLCFLLYRKSEILLTAQNDTLFGNNITRNVGWISYRLNLEGGAVDGGRRHVGHEHVEGARVRLVQFVRGGDRDRHFLSLLDLAHVEFGLAQVCR